MPIEYHVTNVFFNVLITAFQCNLFSFVVLGILFGAFSKWFWEELCRFYWPWGGTSWRRVATAQWWQRGQWWQQWRRWQCWRRWQWWGSLPRARLADLARSRGRVLDWLWRLHWWWVLHRSVLDTPPPPAPRFGHYFKFLPQNAVYLCWLLTQANEILAASYWPQPPGTCPRIKVLSARVVVTIG